MRSRRRAAEFDQFLDSARTIARSLNGAVLAFTPDAYGDGTEVRLLSGGPNDEPAATTLPMLHARATIEETESLGKVPFAFVVHANGSLSGRPGYRVGDSTKNDVGCPPSGAFHFVIKAAGGSADRYVPCRMTLANNGPATLTAWPLGNDCAAPDTMRRSGLHGNVAPRSADIDSELPADVHANSGRLYTGFTARCGSPLSRDDHRSPSDDQRGSKRAH